MGKYAMTYELGTNQAIHYTVLHAVVPIYNTCVQIAHLHITTNISNKQTLINDRHTK